jgi:hypothetical protein
MGRVSEAYMDAAGRTFLNRTTEYFYDKRGGMNRPHR